VRDLLSENNQRNLGLNQDVATVLADLVGSRPGLTAADVTDKAGLLCVTNKHQRNCFE
jgi:hypothetical protein